jgi:drug/metabolite transporter (DMT)-like permease
VTATFLAIAGAFATALAQILLKAAARRRQHRSAVAIWLSLPGLAAGTLLFGATLLNLAAFSVLPLKVAVAIHPIVIVSVVAGSRIFLGERIGPSAAVGLALIGAGVGVFLASGW